MGQEGAAAGRRDGAGEGGRRGETPEGSRRPRDLAGCGRARRDRGSRTLSRGGDDGLRLLLGGEEFLDAVARVHRAGEARS